MTKDFRIANNIPIAFLYPVSLPCTTEKVILLINPEYKQNSILVIGFSVYLLVQVKTEHSPLFAELSTSSGGYKSKFEQFELKCRGQLKQPVRLRDLLKFADDF